MNGEDFDRDDIASRRLAREDYVRRRKRPRRLCTAKTLSAKTMTAKTFTAKTRPRRLVLKRKALQPDVSAYLLTPKRADYPLIVSCTIVGDRALKNHVCIARVYRILVYVLRSVIH